MDVQQLAPGLWRWTAPHPDWERDPAPESPADWPRDVGCVYYEAPDAVVLVDPLIPPERDPFLEALDRDVKRLGLPVAILLTVSWHDRSAAELAARYGATHETPAGVQGLPVACAEETLYWLPDQRALIAGDVLIGDGNGGIRICPVSWLPDRSSVADVRRELRAVLSLPVERVLVSHWEPVLEDGHAALAAALTER